MTFLERFFTSPFRLGTRPGADAPQADAKLSLLQIQQALGSALHDCTGVRRQRIQYRIDNSKTPAELWALRSDLHQCIAQTHSERVATARINDVATAFEGWLPASQLIRIQPRFRNSQK